MKLIDSHCHLNYEGLVERQAEVLETARERGVAGFLNISTRQREWSEIIGLAERDPTSGRALESTRMKPTIIPISEHRLWSRQPTIPG